MENKLPKRFYQRIKFELGFINKKQPLDAQAVIGFTNALFFKFQVSPLITDTALFFRYYNDYCFDNYQSKKHRKNKSLDSIELFFNDINLVDELVETGYLQFVDYKENITRPFASNVFYFDNYAFYNNDHHDMEELSFTSINDDSLKKFGSTADKPYGLFTKASNKYKKKSIHEHVPHYYLVKSFMSLLMDEERFYFLLKSLGRLILQIIVILLVVYVISQHLSYYYKPVFVYVNEHIYSMMRTYEDKFWEDLNYYKYHPFKFISLTVWNMCLIPKMFLCYLNDVVVFQIFPRGRVRRFLAFRFEKPKKKMYFSKILEKIFW